MTTEPTFGVWLRQQRRQLDWTQVELAQPVGYSVATIRKLERDELRPSKRLAELLAHALDVAITQHASLVSFARATPTLGLAPDAQPLHQERHSNLPAQLTPFFGRTAEIVDLTQQLTNSTARLITIVGPGGMGKTRLALEVAQSILDLHSQTDSIGNPKSKIKNQKYADGVYFVALAPLHAPEHIVPAIAEAINLRFQADSRLPKTQLLDYLRHKQVLLVLDNFEHLQAGAELILELLQECPALRLLVTSREHLQLSSETRFVLESLAPPATATLPAVLSYSAIQLFVEIACRLRPKFTLTPANAQAVVRICQLVGAMPLGIILAAAWVEVLSPDEIVTELSEGFDFLESELRDLPERQRSMRAVLTQSWQRLTEAERTVFMRLAVFRGGFTRMAAQQVAGASLRMISTLVNKSLVQYEPSGRYTIHELLRQFTEQQLETTATSTQVREDHAAYFLKLAEEAEIGLSGVQQVLWTEQVEGELANFRAVMTWCKSHAPEKTLRIANALHWFWQSRGHIREGCEWLYVILNSNQVLSPGLRADALSTAGFLSLILNDVDQAAADIEQSIALYQALDIRENTIANGFSHALARMAAVALRRRDYPAVAIWSQQALEIGRRINARWSCSVALYHAGDAAYLQGDFARAQACYEESLTLCEAVGNQRSCGRRLAKLGHIACIQAEVAQANLLFKKALTMSVEYHDLICLGNTLIGLARVANMTGDDQKAIALLAANEALSVNRLIGRFGAMDQHEVDRVLTNIKARLDEVTVTAAWTMGLAMSTDQAVAYALAGPKLT